MQKTNLGWKGVPEPFQCLQPNVDTFVEHESSTKRVDLAGVGALKDSPGRKITRLSKVFIFSMPFLIEMQAYNSLISA
jgi:hypothetical protein